MTRSVKANTPTPLESLEHSFEELGLPATASSWLLDLWRATQALDDVADGLKKHPRLKVELQGHTDSRGPDAYNLTLSQKRADAVRAYLIKDGVPATQITAKGYGEGQPIADNKTDAGRAQNRRVVMLVVDNPGDVEVKGAGEAK